MLPLAVVMLLGLPALAVLAARLLAVVRADGLGHRPPPPSTVDVMGPRSWQDVR